MEFVLIPYLQISYFMNFHPFIFNYFAQGQKFTPLRPSHVGVSANRLEEDVQSLFDNYADSNAEKFRFFGKRYLGMILYDDINMSRIVSTPSCRASATVSNLLASISTLPQTKDAVRRVAGHLSSLFDAVCFVLSSCFRGHRPLCKKVLVTIGGPQSCEKSRYFCEHFGTRLFTWHCVSTSTLIISFVATI